MSISNTKKKPLRNPVHAIVLSLVMLLTLTLFSMLAVIFFSVYQVNNETRENSILSTDSILKDKLTQMETVVLDYAFWDNLIKHAYFSHNLSWIDNNIGKYLTDVFKITDVIILDGQDNPVLAINHGIVVDTHFYDANLDDLKILSAKARKPTNTLRGISGISSFHNHPILLAASILTPEEGDPLPAPAPVLIFGKQLNKDFLSAFSKQFQLSGLQFIRTARTDNTQAFININNVNNQPIGQLVWSPIKPSDQVIDKTKTPLLFLLIGCGLVLLVIIRSTRTITRRLEDASKDVKLLSTAINQSQSIILIFDHEGTVKYSNTQADHFFNIEIVDKNISDFIPMTTNENFHRILKRNIKKADLWHGDFEYKSSPEESIWMHASLAPVIEPQTPTHIICVMEDISRLKTAFDDMAHLATHDALTELINRRLFNDLLQQVITSSKRDNESSALLYIDLDGFKHVNDTLGHQIGDELLIETAARLKTTTREADIVARIGGDEFAVLLKNLSQRSDIDIILKKILFSLSQPLVISGNNIQITASIGATMIPTDGMDADTLMSNADLALYESKAIGRNTFQFYSDIADIAPCHTDLTALS